MVVGGGWVVVCKPILVFSLSLGQAEQYLERVFKIAKISLQNVIFQPQSQARVSRKRRRLCEKTTYY